MEPFPNRITQDLILHKLYNDIKELINPETDIEMQSDSKQHFIIMTFPHGQIGISLYDELIRIYNRPWGLNNPEIQNEIQEITVEINDPNVFDTIINAILKYQHINPEKEPHHE